MIRFHQYDSGTMPARSGATPAGHDSTDKGAVMTAQNTGQGAASDTDTDDTTPRETLQDIVA